MELDRPDSRSIGPSGPAQAVAAFQGAGNVQVTNANINVVGGDSYSHTHVHCHGTPDFKDLKAFLDLISNFRKIQQDTLAKATPGTVKWLFVSKFFSVWWNGSGNMKVLWGSGIPGAGKTILASLVIAAAEHRAADPKDQVCVAYFYMRYSEHGEVTVRAVLEVFVKQILERHEELLTFAEKVYVCHIREGTRPTESQLLGLLQEFTVHMKVTFYILDALDEAPIHIQHDLVEKLASLNARIFITSRPMQNVQAYFPEAHCFVIAAQDRDLDLHIAKKLQASPTLRALLDRGEASVKQRVISTVKSKCGGMFLHASLQLDALQRCLSIHSVMQTLDQFPTKIEDVYRQTWQRILDQDLEHANLAKLALVWVLYAKRSLTIEQLLRAIAICPETHSFEEGRLVLKSTIVDLCYGLITVDDKSRLVRLVHYTAKQPMEDLLRIPFPHPHSLLVAVCIARLTDCGFQNTSIDSIMELDMALRADPLLHYAYHSWISHAQKSLDLDLTASRTIAFIAGCRAFPVAHYRRNSYYGAFDTLNSLHMVAFYNLPIAFAGPRNTHDTNAPTVKRKVLPLHLACVHGHHVAMQGLLCSPGIRVNARGRHGETGLILACSEGFKDVVALLLAHPDINVNLVDKYKTTALIHACKRGNEATIKLLLAHPDIDVNSVDRDGDTALSKASRKGHGSVATLLLADPYIEVNLPNNHGDTAILLAACNGGDSYTIELLLAHPNINTNLVDKYKATALILASERGFEAIVNLLLAHPEIEVNMANYRGDTPLIIASRKSYKGIVKSLLAHPNIAVNLANHDGNTALTTACRNGHNGVAMLLLADPNIEVDLANKNGDTPLLLAAANGSNTDTVELLLAHPNTNVNRVDKYKRTALMRASERGFKTNVKALLAHPSIHINLVNQEGSTALINASRKGCAGTVTLLLAHPSIKVNLVNNDGDTALLLAASRESNASTVKLLLAHPDIDVNLGDGDGDTALINASREGYESIVTLLLAHPAILVNLLNDGETALIAASSWVGNQSTVERLLTHPDTKASLPGRHGNTALMTASFKGHLSIIQLLIAASGVDINLTNEHGETAIKMAAENGHDIAVQILLEAPGIDVAIISTRDDHSAMAVALEKGHLEVVRALREFEDKHRLES